MIQNLKDYFLGAVLGVVLAISTISFVIVVKLEIEQILKAAVQSSNYEAAQ